MRGAITRLTTRWTCLTSLGGRDAGAASNGAELEALLPGFDRAGTGLCLNQAVPTSTSPRFTRPISAHFRRAAAALSGSTPLASARQDGDGWAARLGDGSTLSAAVIVNAAGAWADDVARACGVRPLGISPNVERWCSCGSPDPACETCRWSTTPPARFYFKGEGDSRVWFSPHDEIAKRSLRRRARRNRRRNRDRPVSRVVVDWPVERGRAELGGSQKLRAGPASALRFRFRRAGFLLVCGAGRLRNPDVPGGGKDGGGAAARQERIR